MKTTIDIDDRLFACLCEATKTTKKGEAIRMAVEEYVARRNNEELIQLLGQGKLFEPDYDYKAWRRLDAA